MAPQGRAKKKHIKERESKMKLYFYHLDENKLKKTVAAGIRENKFDYTIPAQHKSVFGRLHDWRLDKRYCNIVQVDDSFYRWSPFIISEKDNLEDIPHLDEMLISVSYTCSSANNAINSFLGGAE